MKRHTRAKWIRPEIMRDSSGFIDINATINKFFSNPVVIEAVIAQERVMDKESKS